MTCLDVALAQCIVDHILVLLDLMGERKSFFILP